MRRLLLSFGFAVLGWNIAAAQESGSAQTAERAGSETVDLPRSPVVVDGVTLFRVRGITGYPAEQRAVEIAGRIRDLGADHSVPVDSITTQHTPIATFVVAGGRRILGVTEADAQLEGTTPPVLAEVAKRRVMEAVARYRHDRAAGYLWRRAGYALAATAGFVLFMSLGRRAWRRLREFVERRYRSRVQDVQIRSVEVVRGDMLWQWFQHGMRLVGIGLTIAAAYVYLDYVLLQFPWTRGLGNSLADTLLQPLRTLAAGLASFLPDLVFLVILVLIARFAIRFIRIFMRRVGSGEIRLESFEPEWAMPTERILRFAVIIFTLIIAYPYIPGSGSEAFKGIGLILGLMFSLGSPSVIGNTVAGLSLAFRRAFKVGDRVKIGEHSGFVSQVRLLTTYLRSFKNEEIVIPNSVILNSEVVNFSTLARDRGLILHTNVGIGYETPWRQVEAMLLEAARRTPGVQREPPPFVLQKKLGDFAVDYEINAYTADPVSIGLTYNALHGNILDVFNEHDVQIMTPAYEGDPEQPKVVPRERWFESPARSVERLVQSAPPSVPADLNLAASTDSAADRITGPKERRR